MTLVVTLASLYSFGNSSEKMDIINIAKSISYIESHYAEDISIDVLAEISHYPPRYSSIALQCGFSDSNYFSRIFKKKTGFTPKQFRASE